MPADLPPAPLASPASWTWWCVLAPGVFSALVWGLGTLFRPRPSFARAAPDEGGGEPEEPPSGG
jgi:hypothetical protein